jgi:Protein of unknown function (DUF3019)
MFFNPGGAMLPHPAYKNVRRVLGGALLVSWLPLQAQTVDLNDHDPVLLTPKPQRCIALHQGQICHQRVGVTWQVPTTGDYCLFWASEEQPLSCWQQQHQGHTVIEFASTVSRTLRLVEQQSSTLVVETRIEVAWVYKTSTRRKTHWRLF